MLWCADRFGQVRRRLCPASSGAAALVRRGEAGRRGGFMLLEAVVALAIISLVAVGVLGLVAGQTRVAYKASVLLVAASLAEERIETLRLLEYYDLVDLPDSLRAGIFPEPLDEFAWVASARLLEDEYDLFSVEVTVFSEDEAFPLQTLIFRERALEEPVVQGSAQMPLPSGPGGPGG